VDQTTPIVIFRRILEKRDIAVRWHISFVALLLLSSTVSAHTGNWRDDGPIDRLSGKKIIQMSTTGHGSVRQFGHTVTSKLTLACAHPDDGSAAYLSAYLVFSEPVAISDVRARYRFDDGNVQVHTIGVSQRGNYFSVWDTNLGDSFFQNLKISSKLKIEVSLPWAGDPLIQFDVAGADRAINLLPCK
jgi:hypothetical protein